MIQGERGQMWNCQQSKTSTPLPAWRWYSFSFNDYDLNFVCITIELLTQDFVDSTSSGIPTSLKVLRIQFRGLPTCLILPGGLQLLHLHVFYGLPECYKSATNPAVLNLLYHHFMELMIGGDFRIDFLNFFLTVMGEFDS